MTQRRESQRQKDNTQRHCGAIHVSQFTENKSLQIPSAKFSNVISGFLKNETGRSRPEAPADREELKAMPVEKNYASRK